MLSIVLDLEADAPARVMDQLALRSIILLRLALIRIDGALLMELDLRHTVADHKTELLIHKLEQHVAVRSIARTTQR